MTFRNYDRPTGAETPMVSNDGLGFVRSQLGFEPDEKQAWLIEERRHRVLLNCTRQWGKSTVTAARAVWEAWSKPESLTVVVTPSARQSAEFPRKAKNFVRRLNVPVKGDGDNPISLELPNHSRIIGLPGNEFTVRGFSGVSLLVIDEAAAGRTSYLMKTGQTFQKCYRVGRTIAKFPSYGCGSWV